MIIYFPHKLGQLKNGVQYTPIYLKKLLKNQYVDVFCNNSFGWKDREITHTTGVNHIRHAIKITKKLRVNLLLIFSK